MSEQSWFKRPLDNLSKLFEKVKVKGDTISSIPYGDELIHPKPSAPPLPEVTPINGGQFRNRLFSISEPTVISTNEECVNEEYRRLPRYLRGAPTKLHLGRYSDDRSSSTDSPVNIADEVQKGVNREGQVNETEKNHDGANSDVGYFTSAKPRWVRRKLIAECTLKM